MPPDEDSGGGVPEWVVTFGDMMSLLLTFFIMLVSLSEIKEQEKYQALVESIQRRFGYDTSLVSLVPGRVRPRNSALAKLAAAGRARKLDIMRGGDKTQAPSGDFPRVQIIRPGSRAAVGGVVFFPPGAVQLGAEQLAALEEAAAVLQGKPQKIEVRGHAAPPGAAPASGPEADPWRLAYARARAVMEALVDRFEIDPRRIRLSVAGANEPIHLDTLPGKSDDRARVEVYLLDEVARELEGTEQERRRREAAPPEAPPPGAAPDGGRPTPESPGE